MTQLNILIHGGAGVVSRLFEESLTNEGYWNKTGHHKKLQNYKYNTDFEYDIVYYIRIVFSSQLKWILSKAFRGIDLLLFR